MDMRQNVSLKSYNTFGINASAERLYELTDIAELPQLYSASGGNIHVIGGGSNILLTTDVKGLTILNRTRSIEVVKEDDEYTWLEVSSGEIWHSLVLYAIEQGLAGIENLALIPGTVGAAPMQNIGAYGVEVKDVIESVTAYIWGEDRSITLSNAECRFGYRDSIFKQELKGRVFITHVLFRLNKQPVYHTEYGAIRQQLKEMGIEQLSVKAIADAVIAIRSSKLPDPVKVGNAGSFFKNPTVSVELHEQINASYPDVPAYPAQQGMVKIPAGWLIEQCGLKGYNMGNAGVHDKQALVLVNKGNATGKEILELSEFVLQSVKNKFAITLEKEVQVW